MKPIETGSDELEKSCEICEFSTPVPGSEAVVCKKHGLIRRDSLCRKFRLDPLKLSPRIKKPIQNPFGSDVFSLDTASGSAT